MAVAAAARVTAEATAKADAADEVKTAARLVCTPAGTSFQF